jgi:hypothetical protein
MLLVLALAGVPACANFKDGQCAASCDQSDAGSPPLADAGGVKGTGDATVPMQSDGSAPIVADGSPSGFGDAAPPASDGGPSAYTTSCSLQGTGGCTCAAPADAGNDVKCDPTAVTGSVCCADSTWPSAGATCSCLTAACTYPAGGGCDCTLGTGGNVCNDGTVCCVSPENECLCTYGVSTCWTGYKTVAQCDAPSIGCGAGQQQVTSCSVPR